MSQDSAPVRRLGDAVRRTRELTAGRPATGLGHDDAPPDVGTFGTDDALGFDPLPLLAALDDAGARVVVIGQVAGILHGSRELTGDLDLLWDGDPAQADALRAGFVAAGATLTDDDGTELARVAATLRRPKVQFRSPAASGDCCTPHLPWGAIPVADYLDRAQTAVTADGRRIHYLARADLVAMRLAVGRPRDLRRAAELERLPPRPTVRT
jgi:hypothetical protein